MSTCDHICRECGQVMNCQHCRPWQLPTDRNRIAELEAVIDATRTLVADGAATGFNPHDGDWADRLFRNQWALSCALNPELKD